MAFRKKAPLILAYNPDILIIPECEHPDKLKFDAGIKTPTNILWQGSNEHKGLGVFSYGDYKMELMDIHNPKIKTILPIRVTSPDLHFTLLAIWAFNPSDKGNIYIGQVWKALRQYKNLLKNEMVILAGDFNSNTIWDKPLRKANHSTVVKKLEKMNIFSSYHIHAKFEQGSEGHPTFYLYHHQDKPYHIDYCFASSGLIENLQNVEVGGFAQWTKYSDHCPVMVNFL